MFWRLLKKLFISMRPLSKWSFSNEEAVQIWEEGVVRYLASAPDKKAAADLSWKGGEREEGHLHNVTVLSFVHL
jgi:hypothetical protein